MKHLSPHTWRFFKDVSHVVTQISAGLVSIRITVGLCDLKGLLQLQ